MVNWHTGTYDPSIVQKQQQASSMDRVIINHMNSQYETIDMLMAERKQMVAEKMDLLAEINRLENDNLDLITRVNELEAQLHVNS